ncbi:MAG: FAD-dependent oxidoreductase [Albidovulum sp.]
MPQDLGLASDSLAAQMIARGQNEFRQTRDGQPRGLFCGMGVCGECRVEVAGRGIVRACMTKAADPDSIQPHSPHRLPELVPTPTAEGADFDAAPEVLIIGAGPGGLSTALTCAQAGLRVVVLDDRLAPGGQFYKQPTASFHTRRAHGPDKQARSGGALIDAVRASGAQIVNGALVWSIGPDFTVHVLVGGRSRAVRPARIVLATGAYERAYPFPGWTEPGVMTTGAVQTLLRSYGLVAGRRFVIAGNGPLHAQVAAELVSAGADVVALVEAAQIFRPRAMISMLSAGLVAPGLLLKGAGYLAQLRLAGTRIITGGVVASVVRDQDELLITVKGPKASTTTIRADTLGVGFGFLPRTELSRLVGCTHELRPDGTIAVLRDGTLRTSVPNVYVVGDNAGLEGAHSAMAQGQIAGADIAAGVKQNSKAHRKRARHLTFQRRMWASFKAEWPGTALADDDTIICRCEDVRLGQLRPMIDSGAAPSTIKKATRCGMGDCQGRYCSPVLSWLCAKSGRQMDEQHLHWAPRPPVAPISVDALADSYEVDIK